MRLFHIVALKMKQVQKNCYLFFSIFLLLFGLSYTVYSFNLQEQTERITEQEKKLKQLQAEIDKYKTKAKEYGSEEKTVLTQLESIELNYRLKNAELEKLNIELQSLQQQISRITKQVDELQRTVDDLRSYIKNRMLSLYKLGRLAYFRYMLSLKNPADMLSCYKYVAILSDRDTQKIEKFRNSLLLLKQSQQSLLENQRALLHVRSQAENKRAEIAQARQERQNYLLSIQQQKELYSKAAGDLEQASQRLKLLIENLRQGRAWDEEAPYVLNIANFKGLLNWPVNGEVLVPFGKVKHPKFNTYTIQNGIDVTTAKGAIISSIFAGKVIYTDWFKTYGNLLIIDHLNGYWSFYAHLDKFLVETGQWVDRNQSIAISGDSSSLKGYCLHFELRHNGIPINPQEWLKVKEK
jgi:septal ring factor EnvC (AmiA/AmiB activator)